jgi:hypothetical protein
LRGRNRVISLDNYRSDVTTIGTPVHCPSVSAHPENNILRMTLWTEPLSNTVHTHTPLRRSVGRGPYWSSSVLGFKRLIRYSQKYFDFLRFSRGRRSQAVEVFEETSPRETGGAKVPFDNLDPENYLGDAGLRSPATRFASPVTGLQGVEDALRGDLDHRLKRRHSTEGSGLQGLHASWTLGNVSGTLSSLSNEKEELVAEG